MNDDIAKIDQHPAIAGTAFLFAVQMKLIASLIQHGVRQSVQHAITGSGADDKVVCKCCDLMDVEQEQVLSLFILQSID